MYRGSGELLQNDYKIHNEIIPLLRNKNIDVITLKEQLSSYYKSKNISPTDTLISKIILGTLGITPALDRYFVKGYKTKTGKTAGFNETTLMDINDFITRHHIELKECREYIQIKRGMNYPNMKIIDMYYWQIGKES